MYTGVARLNRSAPFLGERGRALGILLYTLPYLIFCYHVPCYKDVPSYMWDLVSHNVLLQEHQHLELRVEVQIK